MKIGIQELLVVFIVALFLVGPDKLPMYAKKLGIALAQFRKFSEDATKDIRESIVEPLEEAQRPLREAIEPITELEKTVTGNVKEIQKSFADIGKSKKPSDLPPAAGTSGQNEPKAEAGDAPKPEEPMQEARAADAGEAPDAEQELRRIAADTGEMQDQGEDLEAVSVEETLRSEEEAAS